MPPTKYDEIEEKFLQLIEQESRAQKIHVLILGPNTNSESPGSRLRKYIATKCKGQKIPVYAERKSLITIYTKALGKYHHFCDYEMKLASIVDAIILIPERASSIAELGLFSLRDDLHQRILLLFNDRYPSSEPTFINLGPRKAYDLGGAEVKDVDYTAKDAIWLIVDDFLSKRKFIKYSNKRLKV